MQADWINCGSLYSSGFSAPKIMKSESGIEGNRVAIVQSNYIPWKGYFDLINSVDTFVLYDDVQYTRRDWRNRNRIKTAHGLMWLTIPVSVKGKFHQKIRDTIVSDASWANKHWETLLHNYRHAPFFELYSETISDLYRKAASLSYLSEINRLFIIEINRLLGIDTSIKCSGDFNLLEGKSERLLGICREIGAMTYISGPAAQNYLNEELFRENGINVEWMRYDGYPEYLQLYGEFEHHVSILDLLFNTGDKAGDYMKASGK